MANPLLDRAPPSEFADRRQSFEIKAKIDDFEELSRIIEADLATLETVSRPQGWRNEIVDIRVSFAWADVQRTLPVLRGRIETRVAAVCQRCLDAMQLPLVLDLDLLLAQGAAGEGREVWELDGDTVRPLDVIEESMIMALPLSAMHAPGAGCDEPANVAHRPADNLVRPFADLKAQMDGDGGD
ncbi:MAG: DUF177 domain-containing protein [Gammaproteobacteria bacterium]|nr:DUF177 domain-containing protein [Gammaproteobacteria bacterium]